MYLDKFERCVLKVKSKQPKSCKSKKWKGKGCYNPWAVCNKSFDGASSEISCPICLNEFADSDANIVIACSNEHRFHKECIENWIIGDNYECPLCREIITINLIEGIFYEKTLDDDGEAFKAKFITDSSEERDIKNGDIRISEVYCNIYHVHFIEKWNMDVNADNITALDWDDDFPEGLSFNEKCRTLVSDNFFSTFYKPERYRLPKNMYIDNNVWEEQMDKETKKIFLKKFNKIYIITEFVEFGSDEGSEYFPESESEDEYEESDYEYDSDDGTDTISTQMVHGECYTIYPKIEIRDISHKHYYSGILRNRISDTKYEFYNVVFIQYNVNNRNVLTIGTKIFDVNNYQFLKRNPDVCIENWGNDGGKGNRTKNKFERCVLKVKSKQPKSCKSKKWKGKGCYNPWAICTKSVGRKSIRRKYKSKGKSKRKSTKRKSKRKSTKRKSKRKSTKRKSKRKSKIK